MDRTPLPWSEISAWERRGGAVLAAPAILTALTALAVPGSWPGDLAVHWTLHAAFVLVAVACLWRRVAVPSALCTLLALACLWPWLLASRGARAPAPPPHVQALACAAANISKDNPDRALVLESLLSRPDDLLALIEVGAQDRDRAQRDPRWPHQRWLVGKGNLGLALLARRPLALPTLAVDGHDGQILASALDLDGRSVAVAVIHPTSPMTHQRWQGRDACLAKVAAWAVAQPGPVLILGDHNTTVAGRAWRRYLDEAKVVPPPGPTPATWPSWLASLGIGIDHVAARDLALAPPRAFAIPGSDHHGLATMVALTTRP